MDTFAKVLAAILLTAFAYFVINQMPYAVDYTVCMNATPETFQELHCSEVIR